MSGTTNSTNSTRIDLRSDTVTQPTEAMRLAMANAAVGDDVFGEDPTVRALEETTAELFGKPAALFVPSGTMANQIALLVHCRPGNEVVIGEGAHCFFYEGGAGAAFAGVQFVEVGQGGLFDADEFEAGIKPDAYYLAETKLVALENTHNRAGGRVFPQTDVVAIAERARARGIAVHVDGARIWNASVAASMPLSKLAEPADTLAVCFSKGLGAPVGSALVGSDVAIGQARRFRRMLGGAMRQAGIIAAGALFSIEHHRERLAEDHENARHFAAGVAELDGVHCDLGAVETNIINVQVADAARLATRCANEGLLVLATGPETIRAVTHLEISRAEIDRALGIVSRVHRATP